VKKQIIRQRTGPYYTVPKTKQISENIREEVSWSENFPVIRGNGN
jgi:hypothetical protein